MFDYFWTDCLSLDQQNMLELDEEIPYMKRIYSRAERVFMFLGYGNREEIPLDYILSWNHGKAPSKEITEAAQLLVSLPFWHRIWIIQEVVLASKGTILAGKSSIDVDDFLLKVMYLLEGHETSSSINCIRLIQTLRQKSRPNRNIERTNLNLPRIPFRLLRLRHR